ncbi:hypothetical protein SAMN05192533_10814 [Mesobacillus persicus]|uniref:Uncharacterized protein n=1 Tax=Mesobacillus persicus TaxID=930146 RepID=A0A1H8D1E6_9BACI|nr:hypothetical protein SAMN05192533_10814 [Mesobacillus persicus]
MQFVSVLFFLAIGVVLMYYLPLISKDLLQITKQNEEIKSLLKKVLDNENKK